VPGAGIFPARVAQADKQFHTRHLCFSILNIVTRIKQKWKEFLLFIPFFVITILSGAYYYQKLFPSKKISLDLKEAKPVRKSKQLISLPLISLAEGLQVGSVRGLVVDPVRKTLAALIIEQKGWFKEQKFIPFQKIHSIGNDAITIEKSNGLERSPNLPDIIKLVKEKASIIGARIVAENGTFLGFADEYRLDPLTGNITGLEISGSFINSTLKGRALLDINHVRTIGREAIITTNEAIENIAKLDSGLQDFVKSINEAGSRWRNIAVQNARNINDKINKRLEKVKGRLKEKGTEEKQAKNGKEQEKPGPGAEEKSGPTDPDQNNRNFTLIK